jgi:DNA-binding beta-propeller fold protein YncE
MSSWLAFMFATVLSLAWGVLVAFGAERGLSAKPVLTASAPTTPAPRDPAPPLRPVAVVYRHAEGTMLRGPRGVFVEPKSGDIYVADTGNHLVAVYDRAGTPLASFGFNREFAEPHKAIVDPQGRVYVLGGLPATVKVFSFRGVFVQDFPLGRGTKGKPVRITTMAIDGAGNLYFGDSGNGEVLVYGPNYQLRSRFPGKAAESLSSISAIAIAESGEIFVVDAQATPAVQVYSPQGEFLRGWGQHAGGVQNFSLPSGIALSAGRVLVVDTLRQTISTFTASGEFLRRDGGLGSMPGAVLYPSDIAADAEGRVYLVERVGNRLQVLAPEFPQAGSKPENGRLAPRPPETSPQQQRLRKDLEEVMRGIRAD